MKSQAGLMDYLEPPVKLMKRKKRKIDTLQKLSDWRKKKESAILTRPELFKLSLVRQCVDYIVEEALDIALDEKTLSISSQQDQDYKQDAMLFFLDKCDDKDISACDGNKNGKYIIYNIKHKA